MAKCSFGKISLRNTFHPKWPFGTELYIRLLYVESGSTQVLFAAVDSLCTAPSETARFRKEVAIRTGIPKSAIWYHELQVHAAPDSLDLRGEAMDRIIALVSDKTNEMISAAVPFRCEVAELDVGSQFSMNREQYIHGLGGVTIWSGMSFDMNRRPCSNDPSVMLLRGYKPALAAFDQPIYFDNQVDSKAYLFVFRNTDNQIIGTLSRFAAHPDVAVLFELKDTPHENEYHYCFVWTGYLSEKLEEIFDAPSMYINGPCADLSTKKGWEGMDTYEASNTECKRIGEEIALRLASGYQRKHISAGDADNLNATTFSFDLPVRSDFPKSREELNAQLQKLPVLDEEIQKAIDQGRPPYEIKTMIDNRWRCMQDSVTIDSCLIFTDDTLGCETLEVTVPVVQLGDYLFIGVPGESLVDMSIWLRSTFTGVKTIPVDQVNGYYNYMATPASLTHGGYTYWSSWVNRESIPVLKEGIVREMEKWLDQE